MTEGYGRDWSNWDAYVAHLWPKPGDVRYKNWCPFLSPKGKWLAFYGKSYTDINIIDLETKELVVRDFYSRMRGYDTDETTGKRTPKPDHVYNGGHCNVSTYVPHFTYNYFLSQASKAGNQWVCSILEDYDFDTFNPSEAENFLKPDPTSSYKRLYPQNTLMSIPLAFNSYTYWAADDCFFVDIIDLSDVDNGNIKLFDKSNFIIPRSADHVRNFVDCDFDGEDDHNKPFNASMSFSLLKAKSGYYFNSDKELCYYYGDENPIKHKELLPWQEVQKRDEEYKAKQAAKEAAKGD